LDGSGDQSPAPADPVVVARESAGQLSRQPELRG